MSIEKILEHSKFAQVGFVVKDANETAAAYQKLFGGKRVTASHCGEYEIMQTRIFGEPAPEANCELAFIDLTPGVQLELIQPNEAPSVWRDALDKYGEGIHHIAFVVDDADAVAAELCEEFNAKVEQQGTYGDGSGQYIYVDCFEKLKCRIELLQSYR